MRSIALPLLALAALAATPAGAQWAEPSADAWRGSGPNVRAAQRPPGPNARAAQHPAGPNGAIARTRGLPGEKAPYPTCGEARAARATPVERGEPGYGRHLDRDGDGFACETPEAERR